MRLGIIWIAALLSTLGARAEAGDAKKPLIAVLEFRTKLAPEEKADADPTYFSDVVRSQALDELPDSRIMTRENMTVLLAASGKDLSQCEGECDVDTGRNLGADDVITGEFLKVGTNFKLDLKLHATADGRLLSGAQASGKTVDELDAAMPAVVTKLLAPLRASPPAPLADARAASPAPTLPPASGPGPIAPFAAGPAPLAHAPLKASPPSAGQPYRYIRVVDDRIVHRQDFFDAGQRDVKLEATPMLREVATALRGPPERRGTVICRSEGEGGAAMRNALQRAWALRHALVEQGVSPAALAPRATDPATQAQLVKQVTNPYVCEIVLR